MAEEEGEEEGKVEDGVVEEERGVIQKVYENREVGIEIEDVEVLWIPPMNGYG